MNRLPELLMLLVIAVLSACGGGGSSPTPTIVVNPNLTVPLQTAMANLVNNGFSKPYTLTGWIDNSTSSNPNLPLTPLSGSGSATMGAPTSVVFTSGPLTGVAALRSTAVFSGSSAAAVTYYFSSTDYTILAVNDSINTFYYSPYTLPTTVKAGSTGTTGSASTGGSLGKTSTGFYSVASDQANSLLVSFTESTSQLGNLISESSTVYRIYTTGEIAPVSITTDHYFLATHYKHVVLNF